MKQQKTILSDAAKVVEQTAGALDVAVSETEKKIEETVAPVRKHVLKRFPVLFLLLVTFGVTATISGIEGLMLQVVFLQNNPAAVLIIGLGLLVLTGTLYKKLG